VSGPPRGVFWPAAFFVASGALALATSLAEAWPPSFWVAWDAVFRSVPHFALAWGLWRRVALARSVALVYCLAVLAMYGVILAIAFAQEPVAFPLSVRVQSLLEVPSCALLFPYLRSRQASALFPRALFHTYNP